MRIFQASKNKKEQEETLLKSFYEASITLISKPDTLKENYSPIFLIYMDAKSPQNTSKPNSATNKKGYTP